MSAYEILAVASAYIGLIITVLKMIGAQNKLVTVRLERGSIKMAEMKKDIDKMNEDLKQKANKDLVENQLKNISEQLGEIKQMLEKRTK
ncbi:MAG: hypothetical protein FD166_1469 [Bacteroidetes bacterium]|nr:MAG: hypothetical protein FD166_1469 [Bacteroidota bacterium]